MRIAALSKVSADMDELQRRIGTLLDAIAYDPDDDTTRDDTSCLHQYTGQHPKETAAVRRQSMELTRALAELRRS